MARTAADLALLYAIIAGPDERDTDIPPVPLGTPPALDIKQLRVAVAPTFSGIPVAAVSTVIASTSAIVLSR